MSEPHPLLALIIIGFLLSVVIGGVLESAAARDPDGQSRKAAAQK